MTSRGTMPKGWKPPSESTNENKTNGIDISYDLTIKRYEQEFSRYQHLEGKAGTQIGFSGVIIAIFSFVFGSMEFDQILKNEYTGLFGWGLGILLISVGIGIAALTKFGKTLPVFMPEKFFDKYDTKNDKREQALYAYFDIIADFEEANNRKAKLLYAGNIATLLGLLVSFISFLLVFRIITING